MDRIFFRGAQSAGYDEAPEEAFEEAFEEAAEETLLFKRDLQTFDEAAAADGDLDTFTSNTLNSLDTLARFTRILNLEREGLVENYRLKAQALIDKADEFESMDYIFESLHSDILNLKRKAEDYLGSAAKLAEQATEEGDREAFAYLKKAYGILEQAEYIHRKAQTILHSKKELY